jgi:hypothetical protein
MNLPKRIILSRKGFDSKYGGCASPIFPDGKMVSLPIYEKGTGLRYRDLRLGSVIPDFGQFVTRFPGHNVRPDTELHLDPDLRRELHRSIRNWRPLFGQCDSAAGHLTRQGVAKGDLFLFFGWFREINEENRYRKDASDKHVLWGWLQIGGCVDLGSEIPDWAEHHPHCSGKVRKNNRVYVGRKHLTFAPQKPGAGIFEKFGDDLRLTHPEQMRRRSFWQLPSFFQNRLSYHTAKKWETSRDQDMVCVSSAKIGQEFVITTDGHDDAVGKWLDLLFRNVPKGPSY